MTRKRKNPKRGKDSFSDGSGDKSNNVTKRRVTEENGKSKGERRNTMV